MLVIIVKGYPLTHVRERITFFLYNVFTAFGNGLLISLIFYVKRREARAAAALHKAEAERHLLSRQAIEAELKLMQAQVEPHFLFNTLASVQYLTETDPKQANVLLGHLIGYLRAALPQLRARSSTLAREMSLAEAYLNILRMRIGPRLTFAIDDPGRVARSPVSAEPAHFAGGERDQAWHRAVGRRRFGPDRGVAGGRRIIVTVTDTGRGVAPGNRTDGQGVGLTNIRERLAVLYGARGRFTLEPVAPRGMRATLSLPFEITSPPDADAQRADRRRRADASRATQGAPRRSMARAEIVAEAENGEQALALVDELSPTSRSSTSGCPSSRDSRSRGRSADAVTSSS